MNELVLNLLIWLLENVMDNQKVRQTIRSWGALLAELIPRNDVEPEIAEFLHLIEEGLTGKRVDRK